MVSQSMEEIEDICSQCEGTTAIFDPDAGETVCESCGVVIRDKHESVDRETRLASSKDIRNMGRTGMPLSLTYHDTGLSTVMAKSNVDAYGRAISPDQRSKMDRMRHWNNVSNNGRGYSRNLKKAFVTLDIIRNKMALSDTITEKAAYNYRKAFRGKMTKGRSITSLVVASVYAACRDSFVPRTIEEISAAANTDPKFAGKCFRLLVRKLGLHLPLIDYDKCLRKIANRANISERTFRRALDMMSEVKENHVSQGKDPIALSAAVLYAACQIESERVNQTQIAVAAGVSVVTLRKRFRDVLSIFPNSIAN